MIRVGVVEDHPVVMEGLKHVCAGITDVTIVACGSSLADGRSLLTRSDIDVILLDIRLEDGNGLTLLTGALSPQTMPAVIVLSAFDDAPYVAAAVQSGACGFVHKSAEASEMIAAIRAAAAGRTFYSIAQLRTAQSTYVQLTRKERAVLQSLLAGRTNDEIASDLSVSPKTVESHLADLFLRFQVGTRLELALAAERGHWLDVDPRPPAAAAASPTPRAAASGQGPAGRS